MAQSRMPSLGSFHKSDFQIQLVGAADKMPMYRAIFICCLNDTISGCVDIGQEPRMGIATFAHPLDLTLQAGDNRNKTRGVARNVPPNAVGHASSS